MKRGADKQISDRDRDGSDDDDGEMEVAMGDFPRASAEEMAKRRIRVPKSLAGQVDVAAMKGGLLSSASSSSSSSSSTKTTTASALAAADSDEPTVKHDADEDAEEMNGEEGKPHAVPVQHEEPSPPAPKVTQLPTFSFGGKMGFSFAKLAENASTKGFGDGTSKFSFSSKPFGSSFLQNTMNKVQGISSGTPLFGARLASAAAGGAGASASTPDDGEGGEDEDPNAGIVMAAASPKVNLEKKQVTSGEEHDKTEFEVDAKLYMLVNKAWKERGVGKLHVNLFKQSPDDSDYRGARVVMRTRQTHQLLLNSLLHKAVSEAETASDKSVRFAALVAPEFVRSVAAGEEAAAGGTAQKPPSSADADAAAAAAAAGSGEAGESSNGGAASEAANGSGESAETTTTTTTGSSNKWVPKTFLVRVRAAADAEKLVETINRVIGVNASS